ncbi:MAG: hypothetical protein K0S44_1306 [Bacteroidetes bacterium]|nr:hypothetical protein [Bacteroidota bacterium]
MLAKALADLLGMKSTGNLQEGIQSVNDLLQSELKTDINTLRDLADDELLPFLANKNLSNNHLELIADLLFESAAEYSEEKRKNCYSKALSLYQFVTDNDITYSINRHLKIEMITSLLKYS